MFYSSKDFSTFRAAATAVFFVLAASACGGGGGGGGDDAGEQDAGTPSQNRVNVGQAVTSVFGVVSKAQQNSSATSRQLNPNQVALTQTDTQTFACDTSGSSTTVSTITIPDSAFSEDAQGQPLPFLLESDAVLDNCDGFSGNFAFDIDGTVVGDTSEFLATINATISGVDPEAGNCTFVFDNFAFLGIVTPNSDSDHREWSN